MRSIKLSKLTAVAVFATALSFPALAADDVAHAVAFTGREIGKGTKVACVDSAHAAGKVASVSEHAVVHSVVLTGEATGSGVRRLAHGIRHLV